MILVEAAAERSEEAWVLEVHAALDHEGLVLRLTFDRPVREALYLAGGAPVSGRLRAVLYLDADDDRATGLDQGPRDLRTGADQRLEVGVVSVGEDPEEKRKASAVVSASLFSLAPDGRRRSLWQGDDAASPRELSVHGEWIEIRLPPARPSVRVGARLILAFGDRSWDGRLTP